MVKKDPKDLPESPARMQNIVPVHRVTEVVVKEVAANRTLESAVAIMVGAELFLSNKEQVHQPVFISTKI